MFEATQFIVCLWLLPVTIYFILPLLALCGYSLARLVLPRSAANSAAEEPEDFGEAGVLSHA
ncbi:MAG: hypothetical protein WBW79_03410 [Desulfocapsaceae bacterium]